MTAPTEPTEAERASALADVGALLADLRARVPTLPAVASLSPAQLAGLVGAVLNIELVLREAGGTVPHDVVVAAFALRSGAEFALEALRDAVPDAAPAAPPTLTDAQADEWRERCRSALAYARTRTRAGADPVAVEDVTWALLARGYADAAGVPLRDVAPDVAADVDAIEAAVRSNRARRRIEALGSDRDVNARNA